LGAQFTGYVKNALSNGLVLGVAYHFLVPALAKQFCLARASILRKAEKYGGEVFGFGSCFT
jgi:hypothetical protein